MAITEEEEVRSFTSWKLDLLQTVNADPRTDPYCLAVVEAYLHFANKTTRSAFLSEIDLQVRTAIQPRAARKAKAALVSVGYLTPIGKTKTGVVVYRLDNPHIDRIGDHMLIAKETLTEAEGRKKALERQSRKHGGSRSAPPKNGMGGADVHPAGGADVHPKHLEGTPTSQISYEREGSNKGGRSAYVREAWSMPMDGSWPALRGHGGRSS